MTVPTSSPSARISQILEPTYSDTLDELSTEEIRLRRNQTLAERDYLSYLRRLIQARQDLLLAEEDRRSQGAGDTPLVDRLTAVLSAGPAGGSRGEVLRLQLPAEDMEEAERRVSVVMGSNFLTRPESLSDEELERDLLMLDQEEQTVSADRNAVFQVHDRLQEELKRRYRSDPSQIPTRI